MPTRAERIGLRNPIHLSALAWCLCAGSGALAQEAPATPAASQAFQQEIVVTATRREAGSQSVPIALTAVGAEQLRNTGITNATGLTQLAPSLVVNTDVSAGSPRYSLRGLSGGDVTPSASPAIATYIDDVPQAALYGVGASIFDIQRVEVLRGPQGTTFGKNTTGGAIAYFSQTPTNEVEGYVTGRLGFGDRHEQSIEGAVNVPIVDQTLAARFSFRADDQNDWQRNLGPAGGKRGGGHGFSGRAQLRWTPDSDTWANLTVYLSRRRGDQSTNHAEYSGPPTALPMPAKASRTTVDYSPYDLHDNFNNSAVTLRVGHDFGLFDLTSVTHYRKSKSRIAQDLDATAYDLFFYRDESDATQYGQEIRLASDATLPLSGLFGLYYGYDKINENAAEASTAYGPGGALSPFVTLDFDGPGPLTGGAPIFIFDYNNPGYYKTVTKTYAVFGNLTYKLTDALSITGGVRKTVEKKRFAGQEFYYIFPGQDWNQSNIFFNPATPPAGLTYPLPQFVNRVKSKPWTWDATVDYNPSRNLLVFARVAKGFRSGGFNQPAGAFPWSPFFDPGTILGDPSRGMSPLGAPPTFAGEKVQSYELGIKSNWGRFLRVNATVYHYDFSNQQVTTFPGGLLFTTNAASSNVDGAEVEVSAYPTEYLDLNGSLSYNNARYDTFTFANPDPSDPTPIDLSGNRLNQAPRWSANWAISYRVPVSQSHQLRMNTNWTYRSKIYFTQENIAAQSDPSRVLGNARVSFEPVDGKGFAIAGYVNNLTNKRPQTFGFDAPAAGYAIRYFGPGRTFGLDLSYRW